MTIFNEKDDMGPEESLELLGLPPEATIDDVNQAFTNLNEKIDRYHQNAGSGSNPEDRKDDIELLTCAYENAVAHLSLKESTDVTVMNDVPTLSLLHADSEPMGLSGGSNGPVEKRPKTDHESVPSPVEENSRTVEEAISITSRRLQQAESALPGAQKAMEAAKKAVESANRRVESVKQASLNALVAAKAAKTRALLLDVEAKRAMETAISVAEKARERADAARRAAEEAMVLADKAREQTFQLRRSEETAAAEAICAEDRMERASERLKELRHKVLEARNRMRLFQETTVSLDTNGMELCGPCIAEKPDEHPPSSPRAENNEESARKQILSELENIEFFTDAVDLPDNSKETTDIQQGDNIAPMNERRIHHRIVFPVDRRPVLTIDDRSIPIVDLSCNGMRLDPKEEMGQRIIRGSVVFSGQLPVKIAGRVIRRDVNGTGVKLVTRIGNQVLDRERFPLSA